MNSSRLRKSFKVKILILIITSILITLMFPKAQIIDTEAVVGSIWLEDDLIAEITFDIAKNENLLAKEIDAARNKVYPVFLRDENYALLSIDSLNKYTAYLISLIDSLNITDENYERLPVFLSSTSFKYFNNLRKSDLQQFDNNRGQFGYLIQLIAENIAIIYSKGLLDLEYKQIERDSIGVRKGSFQEHVSKFTFFDKLTAIERISGNIFKVKADADTQAIKEFAKHFLFPDLIYSQSLTEEDIASAIRRVPVTMGIVSANERIVSRHERITPEIKSKIDSYHKARAEQITLAEIFKQIVGKFLHICALLLLLGIFISNFRKQIYEDNFRIIIFSILVVWMSYIVFWVNRLDLGEGAYLLVIIPCASMLLSIIFDSRIGFYSTAIICLITAALRGNDYNFAVANLIAGTISVYTVRDIKKRTQIFKSALYIFCAYAVSIVFFQFEKLGTWSSIGSEVVFAGISSIVSPVFTYGLLIFFERFFKITTDLTLLELADNDNPVLIELRKHAPGTFTHSMMVGNLSEAAAERIGANRLLIKVGALYHDIGKAVSPYYFVENQLSNKNLHDELRPEDSVKIILEHVARGIQEAKDKNIPQEIIDFIPTHHGTTVIKFFYDKAVAKYGKENVNQDDYRYKGPKPFSKETAILMLADTCESASRTLDEPTPEKLDAFVRMLVAAKLEDNQLNEAPVTLQELELIQRAFIDYLSGHYHRRIRYPQQDRLEEKIE